MRLRVAQPVADELLRLSYRESFERLLLLQAVRDLKVDGAEELRVPLAQRRAEAADLLLAACQRADLFQKVLGAHPKRFRNIWIKFIFQKRFPRTKNQQLWMKLRHYL